LFKHAAQFIANKKKAGITVEVMPWGRRAKQFASKAGYTVLGAREKVLERPGYGVATELSQELVQRFLDDGFDRVYLGYVEFKSALSQVPTFEQVLPIVGETVEQGSYAATQTIVEPKLSEMLEGLLKRKVAWSVFRAMLEGAASEHGARMTAMDSATNNANEVLRRMKIQYNRARQAAITKELIEITSGAQAL
jgi:F-type H+-transporting ATPase subunit gamma